VKVFLTDKEFELTEFFVNSNSLLIVPFSVERLGYRVNK